MPSLPQTPSLSPDSEPSELASRLAVLSLAAGLIFCCPITGLLAVVTGGAALFLGRNESVPSWRKYAWGGVLLGMVGLCATPLLAWSVSGWWEREGRILFSGPNNALYELYQDAPEAFLGEFELPSQTAPTLQSAEAFKERLLARHGEFMRSLSNAPPVLDGPEPWVLQDYVAQFKTTDGISEIPVTIGLIRTPSDTLKLIWIEFDSDSETPLRFPSMSKELDG